MQEVQFLNIDFECFFNKKPDYLLDFFDQKTIAVLFCGENPSPPGSINHEFKYLLALELNSVMMDSIIDEFQIMIDSFDDEAKNEWSYLRAITFDIGYNVVSGQSPSIMRLPKKLIALANKYNAEIVVTTYSIPENEWDDNFNEAQKKTQFLLDPDIEDIYRSTTTGS